MFRVREVIVPLLAALALAGAADRVAAQSCVGCSPLDDLAGAPHRGEPMGLYPGGTNTPPAGHQTLALAAAAGVVPRDATGAPAANGLIGLLSIGMSNCNQEFAAFERLEDVRPGRNPRLVVIDGAVGGQSADIIRNPAATYWNTVTQRLAAAGVDPDQIQLIWLKEADGAVPDTSFPAHADSLRAHLKDVVRILKGRYPNLALCYLSSRIYGGYSSSPERGEPLTYETGFSVRGLIADQIAGDPALNADPDIGPLEAPVLLWGPYLWANGVVPRPGDGLVWSAADLESDNVHPSPSGEAKVAGLLAAFLAAEPTAAPWRDALTGEFSAAIEAEADAWVDDAAPLVNHGLDPVLQWQNPGQRSYVRFDLGSVTQPVFHAKLSLKTPPDVAMNRVDVVVVTNTTWGETTIVSAGAPAFDGAFVGQIPSASRGTALSLDVTTAVNAAVAAGPGARLSLGLRLTLGGPVTQQVLSREALDGPRLVLSQTLSTSDARIPPEENPAGLRADRHPFRGRGRFLAPPDGSSAAPSELQLYDIRGRLVRSLDGTAAGTQERAFAWDGRDAAGAPAPAGVYLARLAGIAGTCRVVLVRP